MEESVMLFGYRVTRAGASVWPSRELRYRWENLTSVRTQVDALRNQCRTDLVFRVGPPLTFVSSRLWLFWQYVGRHCDALALILAGAPPTATIDARSREIAEWGTTAVGRRLAQRRGLRASSSDLLLAARYYRARLDLRRARRALEELQVGNPGQVEAAQLQAAVLVESGASLARVIAALERWHALAPADVACREQLAVALLAAGEARGVTLAQSLLLERPELRPVASSLATFQLHRGEAAAAEATWQQFARHAANAGDVRDAYRAVDYVRNWSGNAMFRARQRMLRGVALALPWVFGLALLGSTGYRIWRRERLRAEAAQAQREAAAQQIADRRRLARTGDPLTGWVIGSTEDIRAAANEGNAAAQYTLGSHLIAGLDGPKAPAEGLTWLEKSAAQENLHALRDLGHIYRDGQIVAKDPARALGYYRRAADAGSPRAAFEAGECYFHGVGAEKDLAAAVTYYRKGADGKNIAARQRLGWCYEKGLGIAPDMAEAVRWYRLAAEAKDEWSALRLASYYGDRNSPAYDEAESFRWALAAGEKGPPELQRYLGAAFAKGKPAPRNLVTARQWFERSAQNHDPTGLEVFGEFLAQGIGGPRDSSRAVASWTEAAKLGDEMALKRLIFSHAFGVDAKLDLALARDYAGQLAKKEPTAGRAAEDMLRTLETWDQREVILASGDRTPEIRVQVRPIFPIVRRIEGVAGDAVVDFLVTRDGRVDNPLLIHASEEEFGAAALQAVALWRFEPGIKNGRPTTTHMQVPIIFTLDEEEVPKSRPE